MTSPQEQDIRPTYSVAVGLAMIAASLQLAVGWMDEHRLTIRPAGHLTPVVAVAWLSALSVALVSWYRSRTRASVPILVLILAVCALVLLW